MKDIKPSVVIVGLLFIGIISIFIYKQQEEKRFSEFEGYEITSIENDVRALYNEDKTDLAKEVTEDKLTKLEQQILDIEKKEYSNTNQSRVNQVRNDFEDAQTMYDLEQTIDAIFEKENQIVKSTVQEDKLETLTDNLTNFQEIKEYYKRNSEKLLDASEQMEETKRVQGVIDALFEEGKLRAEVTQEELEEAQTLIQTLRSETLKSTLLARINGIEVVSAEEDEPEDSTEEELEQQEELEVVREPEREPERTPEQIPEPTRPSRPSTPEPERAPAPTPTRARRPDPEPEAVSVVRVVEQRGSTVDIPFETNRINDASLPAGEETIVQTGRVGKGVRIMEVTRFSDGNETRREVRVDVVESPRNRVVQVGTQSTNEDDND